MNRSSKFAIAYSLSPTILHAVSLARSAKEEALNVIGVLERQRQRWGASDFHKWHDKLVHRLLNPFGFAAGQLAVFQGASEARISESIQVERATRKNSQPAAARRVALKMGRRLRCSSVTSRTILIPAGKNQICRSVKWCGMRPPRALPAAHFERNEAQGI